MLTLSSFATRLHRRSFQIHGRDPSVKQRPTALKLESWRPGGTNPPALQQAGNSEVCLEPRSFAKKGEREGIGTMILGFQICSNVLKHNG